MTTEKTQVLIAGAGASGLMAAIVCAEQGKKVLVIEHKEKPGKKILATGNGKCNFTNSYLERNCFHSDRNDLAWEALSCFGVKDSIRFFERLGILSKEKNGYYYPYSGQAAAILEALVNEAERLGVIICCQEKLKNIEKKEEIFSVQTDLRMIESEKVIISVGGKAAPKLGTEGNGYKIARKFGHTVLPTVPALTGLQCQEQYLKDWAGVRTEGRIIVYIDGKNVAEDTGELQLTNYGISGIPVFQVSRFASKAFYDKKQVTVVIDFMPSIKKEECIQWIERLKRENQKKSVLSLTSGMLNKKLAQVWLKQCKIPETEKIGALSSQQITDMVCILKEWKISVEDTNGFDQAQVTAGGISLEEVHMDTMESKKVKDLYFTGEILDVDGICGGYNLQWAWTSGYMAGKAAGGM